MELKKCSKCRQVFERSEFCRNRRTGDGLQARCKPCHRAVVSASNKGSKRYKEYQAEYRLNNPQKVADQKRRQSALGHLRAQKAVEMALLRGDLTRPTSCQKCGASCRPHGHHESYDVSRRLDVDWLCPSCHGKRHAALRRDKARELAQKDKT